MKTFFVASLFVASAVAFPALFEEAAVKKAETLLKTRQDPLGISKARTNCGPTPCLTFNYDDQLVSVTGEYAYASPAANQVRGLCPGLNAAANHGYLPRSGFATIAQAATGLEAAYNLNPVLGAALAAYAVALDGNVLLGLWSIGGPLPAAELLKGVTGGGEGLSYSHNNYEGDSSIGRNDAYLNNGDAHSLNVTKFQAAYETAENGLYTLDLFVQHFQSVQEDSIANNPYYFTGAFSTIVVVPAAYNFVINLMSNHTAEEPSGYLDAYTFKSFFAISGEPGSFVWNRGQEQIPYNWFRRPTDNQYTANDVAEDVAIGYAAYPDSLRIGGNTGTPNSYVGLSVSNFTGGVFDASTLLEGDNAACFFFTLAQQAVPDFLKGPSGLLDQVNALLDQYISPILAPLTCPQLGQYDESFFNQFPGYAYSPSGYDQNYKK